MIIKLICFALLLIGIIALARLPDWLSKRDKKT